MRRITGNLGTVYSFLGCFWFAACLGGAYGSSQSPFDAVEERRATQRPARPLVPTQRLRSLVLQTLHQKCLPIRRPLQQRRHLHHTVVSTGYVGGRTGPTPPPRRPTQPGPHGIALHVPGRPQQITLIHRERREAALPQVSPPAFAKVDASRIASVGLAQRPTQPIGPTRHHNQMHVVRHQAIRPDRHAAAPAPFAQQRQIRRVVGLDEERLLPPIAPLRHVMRNPGNHNSRQSCHTRNLTNAPFTVNTLHGNAYTETMKQASFRIVHH
jgi:hypothetical protein